MKKKIMNIVILLVFATSLIFVYRYLWVDKGEIGKKNPKSKTTNSIQREDVGKKESEFAEKIFADPNQVFQQGKDAICGQYVYKVESLKVSKEFPNFDPLPDKTELLESREAKLDDAGKILNDKSYLIVEMKAKNKRDEAEQELFWPSIRLKLIGVGSDKYIGMADYIGVKGQYCDQNSRIIIVDHLGMNEEKRRTLIYVIPDDLLEQAKKDGLYLEINPTGAVASNSNEDIRCFIMLDF